VAADTARKSRGIRRVRETRRFVDGVRAPVRVRPAVETEISRDSRVTAGYFAGGALGSDGGAAGVSGAGDGAEEEVG
jgi:hypothetical protein